MSENWIKIEGEEGYCVSDQGRVMSVNYRMTGKEHLMKQSTNKRGLKVVNIRGTVYLVHQLVAKAFVHNPNEYSDVYHINGDPTDNRADNLYWAYRNKNKNKQEA